MIQKYNPNLILIINNYLFLILNINEISAIIKNYLHNISKIL